MGGQSRNSHTCHTLSTLEMGGGVVGEVWEVSVQFVWWPFSFFFERIVEGEEVRRFLSPVDVKRGSHAWPGAEAYH